MPNTISKEDEDAVAFPKCVEEPRLVEAVRRTIPVLEVEKVQLGNLDGGGPHGPPANSRKLDIVRPPSPPIQSGGPSGPPASVAHNTAKSTTATPALTPTGPQPVPRGMAPLGSSPKVVEPASEIFCPPNDPIPDFDHTTTVANTNMHTDSDSSSKSTKPLIRKRKHTSRRKHNDYTSVPLSGSDSAASTAHSVAVVQPPPPIAAISRELISPKPKLSITRKAKSVEISTAKLDPTTSPLKDNSSDTEILTKALAQSTVIADFDPNFNALIKKSDPILDELQRKYGMYNIPPSGSEFEIELFDSGSRPIDSRILKWKKSMEDALAHQVKRAEKYKSRAKQYHDQLTDAKYDIYIRDTVIDDMIEQLGKLKEEVSSTLLVEPVPTGMQITILPKHLEKHYNQFLYPKPDNWSFDLAAKMFDTLVEDGQDIMIHAGTARNMRVLESVFNAGKTKFVCPDVPTEGDIRKSVGWAAGALTEALAQHARYRRKHMYCDCIVRDTEIASLVDEWIPISTDLLPDRVIYGKNHVDKVFEIPVKRGVKVPYLMIDGDLPRNPYPIMSRLIPRITEFWLSCKRRVTFRDKLIYAAVVCYYTEFDIELFMALVTKVMYDKIDHETLKTLSSTAQQWVAKHRPEWDDITTTSQLATLPESLSAYYTVINKTLTTINDSNFVLHNAILTRGVSTASGFLSGLSESLRFAALPGPRTQLTAAVPDQTTQDSAVVTADSTAYVL